MRYEIHLSDAGDGWIVAEVPKLPGCISQGRNGAEAMANIREAIAGWLWAERLKSQEAQRSKSSNES